MQTVIIEGNKRTSSGKNASKLSRNQSLIPCVLYGKNENIQFEAKEKDLLKYIVNPNFYKVNVSLEGINYETLMREIQFHPVTDKVLHVDFVKLDPTKKIIAEVPLKTHGASIGVKNGAKLVQKVKRLKVRAFPADLVDSITVDVSDLDVGKSIRIGDISVKNIEVLGSKAIPVIACLVPRVMKVEEPKAVAATAAAAPAADASKDSKDKK